MAATGLFAAAYSNVTTALANAGLAVVTDPRNARPLSVFVELPTASGFNSNIIDVTIVCRILSAPPGNQDAADYLLTTADTIQQLTTLAVTDCRPSVALIGDQNIPAFDLTVRVSAQRS
jgi:hypothetical protein